MTTGIITAIGNSYQLVSRNGVNYKYRGFTVSRINNWTRIRWDDSFIVSRNNVNYKCEWKDIFGFAPTVTWPNTSSTGITTIGTSTDTFSDLTFAGNENTTSFSRANQWGMINDKYVWVTRDEGDSWIRMDGTTSYAHASSECPGTDTWNYMDHSNSWSVPLTIVGTGGRYKYNYRDYSNSPYFPNTTWGGNWIEVNASDHGAGTRSINQVVTSLKTNSNTWMYAADDGYVGFNAPGDGSTYTVTYPFGTTNAPDATCCAFGGGIWQSYSDSLIPVSGNYWMVGASNGKIAYAAYVNNSRPATSDWTEVNTGLTTVDDIAWGNGVWIAVGYSGSALEVATSTDDDGSNWTISTGLPADMTSYGAASRLKFSTQNRMFILMLKDRRHVMYSKDGSSWTVTYPQTGSITDGVYGIDFNWEMEADGPNYTHNEIDYSNTDHKWMLCGENRICEKSLPDLISNIQNADYLICDNYYASGRWQTYKILGQNFRYFLLHSKV